MRTTPAARIVIAGTHSGVGKTTVATGLMTALGRRGNTVASAKVGPDFIDPGYHSVATGRPGRNLDSWMSGPEAIPPLAERAALGADILVVEGVMGLFDGPSSTAEIAELIDAPIVLVVDASSMSGSVAALLHGYHTFSPTVRLSGVVLNRVGSPSHEASLRAAIMPLGIPVLGAIPRDESFTWRDRHLGLVPVVEQRQAVIESLRRLGDTIVRHSDLHGIELIARSAGPMRTSPLAETRRTGRATIAVAAGPAFGFIYPENLERLEAAGAEIVFFDPISATRLPEGAAGLYAAGGFPEVFTGALAENRSLCNSVRESVRHGLVTWAECGGMLWLSRSLDGRRMCSVIGADAHMTRTLTLGYRTVSAKDHTPISPPGAELRGHEYHYSMISPAGQALTVSPGAHAGAEPAAMATPGRTGTGTGTGPGTGAAAGMGMGMGMGMGAAGEATPAKMTHAAGFASASMIASYVHLHLGADPRPAERFVATASAFAAKGPKSQRPKD